MTKATAFKAIADAPTARRQARARGFRSLAKRIERLFGLVFCAVVLLNFVSAALRYGGAGALVGADEVQVYVMVWLIFLGAAVAGIRHSHLRMDIFVQRLGPKLGLWRELFESILSLAICILMTWVSLNFANEMMAMGQRSDGAGIPMWLVHAAPAAGFLGLAVGSGWDLILLALNRHAAGVATESGEAP
ncbi:MAG TPA: TRAP transporter small permease [Burkholderiaceae bacterium]|nr:TRAP transporter small permease [Burkholderiaceae bacterium]